MLKALKKKTVVKKAAVVKKATKAEKAVATNKASKKWVTPKYVWEAPEGLDKSCGFEVTFNTEQDGLPGGQWRVLRIVGKYPAAKESNIHDMREIDPVTAQGIISRLSAALFHSSGKPTSKGIRTRLLPKTQYKALIWVTMKRKDDTCSARVKQMWRVERKKGKRIEEELEKSDPDFKKISKANKHLAGAFVRLTSLPDNRKRR